jgi:hypothetical protein
MSGDGWDDLLTEAADRLSSGSGHGELGERYELGAGEAFRGRWRGEGVMQTADGERRVFHVWDAAGGRRFLYAHARLAAEVDEGQPAIGDRVLVLRGEDESFTTKAGEERTVFPYALAVRPCDDPLPSELAAAPAPSEAPSHGDIPF